MDDNELRELNRELERMSAEQILSYFLKEYKGEIALSNSLSLEDQTLTDMICKIDPEVRIFTLDTGRVFPEAYDLIDSTKAKYNKSIEIFFPNADSVEKMVAENSVNLFYESVEKRKLCCAVRKIEPLRRAFKGLKVWICGLRQEQSITRFGLQPVEWDDFNGLLKVSPLYNWSAAKVREYIDQNEVPYNPLCDQGFLSIGCQPCTRAVAEGEDERAGRWWWESPESKECGLHKRG
ncbi:MAG: phosphoadenylyl-sulfate reductase [Rikenellaceae bacterium]